MLLVIAYIFLNYTIFIPQGQEPQDRFYTARKQMVEEQLKLRGISNKQVLEAFINVERHKFVLPNYLDYAYIDSPLPISDGQTISQPFTVAFMTQSLKLTPEDKVLEIGTGSGYQAAILAELGVEVYSIEIIENLAKKAKQVLDEKGYKNLHLKTGDGYKGWAKHAPFDGIIVTCAPSEIPQPLLEQLAEDGRMIIPVGNKGAIQKLMLVTKKNGKIRKRNILPVRFVPMVDTIGKGY